MNVLGTNEATLAHCKRNVMYSSSLSFHILKISCICIPSRTYRHSSILITANKTTPWSHTLFL